MTTRCSLSTRRLLRVSVGLEEVEHLKADLERWDFGGELALQNVCF